MDIRNILLLAFLCLSAHLLAQPVSEGSESVGHKNLAVEPSLLISSFPDDMSSSYQFLVPTSLFRYGISDKIEIRVQGQNEILKDNETSISGFGDLFLGLKYQLDYNESRNSQIAFMSTLQVPSGRIGLSSDTFGIINSAIFHRDLSDEVNLLLNLSHSYFGAERGDINYSFIMTSAINDKLSFYFEPFGDIINFEELEASMDAGFSYAASEKLAIDITYGIGLNHRMNFISLGASWLVLSHPIDQNK